MNAILAVMDLATRILIVDDDAGIRSLVSSFLEKHGFKTDAAGDPAEMRVKLNANNYDLIVLDVMMPGEDGLTALRKLQKGDGPPVIMLSAVGTDIDRVVGLEMGAEDYMAKPCNPRELLARIRTVAANRKGRTVVGQGGRRQEPLVEIPGIKQVTVSVLSHIRRGELNRVVARSKHVRRRQRIGTGRVKQKL